MGITLSCFETPVVTIAQMQERPRFSEIPIDTWKQIKNLFENYGSALSNPLASSLVFAHERGWQVFCEVLIKLQQFSVEEIWFQSPELKIIDHPKNFNFFVDLIKGIRPELFEESSQAES